MPVKDSLDKIRLKSAPKQFKSGTAGLRGRARLQRTVHKLLLDAARFAGQQPGTPDAQWAARLVTTLVDFNREKDLTPPAALD
jgi:hypothetical protein